MNTATVNLREVAAIMVLAEHGEFALGRKTEAQVEDLLDAKHEELKLMKLGSFARLVRDEDA